MDPDCSKPIWKSHLPWLCSTEREWLCDVSGHVTRALPMIFMSICWGAIGEKASFLQEDVHTHLYLVSFCKTARAKRKAKHTEGSKLPSYESFEFVVIVCGDLTSLHYQLHSNVFLIMYSTHIDCIFCSLIPKAFLITSLLSVPLARELQQYNFTCLVLLKGRSPELPGLKVTVFSTMI